jgi:ABC-2 type transport system permease protein
VISPSQVVLVAEREVREQLRGKPVWISTAITLVGVVLAVVLPHVFASGTKTYDVAVVGQANTAVRGAIAQAARNAGARADVHVVPDVAAAKAALRASGSQHADIALDPPPQAGGPPGAGRVIVDRAITPGSTDRGALVAEGIARTVAVTKAIATSGVTQAQARALLAPQPLALDHLRPAPASSAHRGLAIGSSIVFFVLVIGFGTAVLTGVVHEKSTRVVEVILSSMRPVNLLAGKVAGASLIVLAQGTLLVVAALLAAKAVGSDILAGSGAGAIIAAGVWIVLGFVLYAWLFAALGSLASRVEDAQSIAFPVQIPLFVGYFASFTAIGATTPSTLVRVLAYVPFTAPMDMSVLTATGAVAWWQVAISMLITLATAVLCARVASTVFQRSILRIGQRVRLRTVLGRGAAATRS